MKKFLLSLFLLFSNYLQAQVYPNIGFENGNLNGWNAFTGQCCPVYITNSGINSASHTIVSGSGMDAYTGGIVPMVAAGSIFSARLGNDSANSEADRLSYTFTVSALEPLLVYQYAVVFQFPLNHPPSKQPRFEVMITNASNDTLPCSFYKEVAANTIPGFEPINEIRFKEWTDAAIDLSDYIGQSVTLQFSTGDCGMGGHFGYAYIDAYSVAMKIKDSTCDINGAITLNAPPGFDFYEWTTGEATQSIQVHNTNAGETISVKLVSNTGCEYYLDYIVPDFVPACLVNASQLCNTKFQLEGTATVSGSVIDSAVFIFDNHSTSQANFTHDFLTEGNHQLTYIAYAANNCRGEVTLNINADKTLTTDYLTNGINCAGEVIYFSNESKSSADKIKYYTWSFDNQNFSVEENSEYSFYNGGNYEVQLLVETENGCEDSISKTINVLNESECDDLNPLYFPNSFSPNNDGKNDLYEINPSHGETISIEIYSRWGELVFKSAGNKISWNGLDKQNKKVQQGLYPAIVALKKQNETIKTSVNIFLLR